MTITLVTGTGDSTTTTLDLQLPHLSDLAAADLLTAQSRSRVEYDDGTEWTETWADLTAWTTTNVAVSSNKLIASAGANSAAFAGAVRSFVLTTTQRARIKGQIVLVATGGSGSPTGKVFVGVANTAAGVLPTDYTTAYGIGFDESNVPHLYFGTTVIAPNETTAAYAAGTYEFTLTVDEYWLSLAVTNAAHTVESVYTFARPPQASNIGAINNVCVVNSDSRGASGHKVGVIGAKTTITTLRTRGSVEGNTVNPGLTYSAASAGQSFRYQLPALYDSRRQAPLVIINHGVGDTQTTPYTNTDQRSVMDALSTAGFAIASGANHGINWGSQNAVDDVLAIYRWMRDHFNIGPLVLCGISMGAMASLNAVARRVLPVAGFVGIYPATNLAEAYVNPAGFDVQINQAYAITTATVKANASAGATAITFGTVFANGIQVLVGSGGTQETVTISSNNGGAGAVVHNLSAPLTYAHNTGEAAVAVVSPTTYVTQTTGYDPNLNTGRSYRGIPMRFYASPGDTTINKTTNTDVLAGLVAGIASENTVIVCSGNHGDPSHFQPADTVAFCQRCVNT